MEECLQVAFPTAPYVQESPSRNPLLHKYKFIVDKGRESAFVTTNEKSFTGNVDVDDKAFKQSARALSGEEVALAIKVENPEWKSLKD